MSGLTPDVLVGLYESRDPADDPPALRGLDQVDWASISHAHGPATDVPALLRAVVSDVPDHREFAGLLLCETVWHQGTVYEATARVVPFLYELLEADGPHDKSGIAQTIAMIATGHPPYAWCEGDPKQAARWESLLRKSGKSLADELERGRRITAAIREQVRKRLDVLYPYIRDPEPAVRDVIARAVGTFPDIAARVVTDLQAVLRVEEDEYVRSTLEEVIGRVRES